jgi:hypothetical protein
MPLLSMSRNIRLVAGTGGAIFRTINNASTTAAPFVAWTTVNAGTADIVSFAVDPKANADSTFNVLAGNNAAEVFLSTDTGNTWTQVPAGHKIGPYASGGVQVAFDPNYATNRYIYATIYGAGGAAAPAVWRLKVGTEDSWTQISGLAGTWPQTATPMAVASSTLPNGASFGLRVGSDGTLYTAEQPPAAGPVTTMMVRCPNPTAAVIPAADAPFFETAGMGWPTTSMSWGLTITAGSNKLWTLGNAPVSGGSEVWTYVDEVVKPTLTSPADGTSSMRVDSVVLGWNAVPNATLYEVFVDTSSAFAAPIFRGQTTQTSMRVPGLEDGVQYFWKVAVFAQSPVLSLWSSTFDFTTELSSAQWNPFIGGVPEAPANGATNVSLHPCFAWNPADWATGYEFQLSTTSDFASPIDSKTGANAVTSTVYCTDQTLQLSTTYYWRVRAVAAATQSEYGIGVFTTVGPTPAPPTAPPTATPATPTPTPTTPVYIWVIIGIGAALVIAVIVLIVRTRRVA